MRSSPLKPLSLFASAVCAIVLLVQLAATQYDTFDFESAHAVDGIVSQTVAGVTLHAESGSGETRVSALRGFGGTTGYALLGTCRTIVLRFDFPVDLVSVRLAESTSSSTSRERLVTFESDTGDSATHAVLDGYRGGAEIVLAFDGVQTLTITDESGTLHADHRRRVVSHTRLLNGWAKWIRPTSTRYRKAKTSR